MYKTYTTNLSILEALEDFAKKNNFVKVLWDRPKILVGFAIGDIFDNPKGYIKFDKDSLIDTNTVKYKTISLEDMFLKISETNYILNIAGHHSFFTKEGLKVGCQTLSFDQIDKIYEKSKEFRATHAL